MRTRQQPARSAELRRLLDLVPPVVYDLPNRKHSMDQWWSQQHPMLFATFALLTAFVPVVALAQIGRMRRRHLAIYLAVTIVLLATLVAYDIWRDPVDGSLGGNSVRIWPSAGFMFCSGLGLFIANQLMEHRERGHRLFNEYAEHFEDSWMRGFQFVISLGFTLMVWGVLELGKALFDEMRFRCPALAFAFAASVHITDVRPALLKGMRNLGLTLLSWLLPLIVALGCAFLIALFSPACSRYGIPVLPHRSCCGRWR